MTPDQEEISQNKADTTEEKKQKYRVLKRCLKNMFIYQEQLIVLWT